MFANRRTITRPGQSASCVEIIPNIAKVAAMIWLNGSHRTQQISLDPAAARTDTRGAISFLVLSHIWITSIDPGDHFGRTN
jgi:hypothetical protein